MVSFNSLVLATEQRLILMANKDGQPDLYTIDINGKDWRRLTYTLHEEKYPKADASGRFIFTVAVNGLYQLFFQETPQKNAIQLTTPEPGYEIMEPFFHPDGKRVYYNRISTNLRDPKANHVTGEIWICNLNGQTHQKVISEPGLHFNPVAYRDQLLIVANKFQTYFDHPLALFLYDFKTQTLSRQTTGFEAHGSWIGSDTFLAIHYQANETDLTTNVYLIPKNQPKKDWVAIGDPKWGDEIRLPNADASGRLVALTARTAPSSEEATHTSPFKGYQVWIIDLQNQTRKAITPSNVAVEGAWFIPPKEKSRPK